MNPEGNAERLSQLQEKLAALRCEYQSELSSYGVSIGLISNAVMSDFEAMSMSDIAVDNNGFVIKNRFGPVASKGAYEA